MKYTDETKHPDQCFGSAKAYYSKIVMRYLRHEVTQDKIDDAIGEAYLEFLKAQRRQEIKSPAALMGLIIQRRLLRAGSNKWRYVGLEAVSHLRAPEPAPADDNRTWEMAGRVLSSRHRVRLREIIQKKRNREKLTHAEECFVWKVGRKVQTAERGMR